MTWNRQYVEEGTRAQLKWKAFDFFMIPNTQKHVVHDSKFNFLNLDMFIFYSVLLWANINDPSYHRPTTY